MPKNKIQINDESGDKKYFTIIPNYVLNHSSAIDQALYLQMKRIAGDGGECGASIRYFKQQLGVGEKAINKSIKYLIDNEWITFIGRKDKSTRGGKQGVNTYIVNDLWKQNIEFYDKGVPKSSNLTNKGVPKSSKRCPPEEVKGVPKSGVKEEPIKKNHEEEHIVGKADEIFNLNKKMRVMVQDKDTRMWIIALYWAIKSKQIENKEQYSSAIRRELRPAKNLIGYGKEQIKDVMMYLRKNADFKWTLETVHKYIDEDLTQIKTKGKTIVGLDV